MFIERLNNYICLGLILLLLLGCGCASIVSKSSYPVMMSCDPPGAKVTVKDEDDVLVFTGTAPSSVVLKAGGAYFDGYNYSFTFEKEGYVPQVVYLRSKIDPWYFGNIVFGGLIGLCIIDPLTGSMMKLSDNVAAVLPADESIKEGGADDSLSDKMPDKEKDKAIVRQFHSGDFPIVAYRYSAATRQGSISVNIEGMGVNARHWLVENIGIICSDKNIALVAGEETRKGARYRVTNESFEDGILTIDFEALY
jgi:hypothetical protein